MTLSKRGDYVVRSALALARDWPGGEPRKIREVVAEMGVPQTFASQILADLVKAGLATSKAGKDGGYRLSRPPEEIPLVEVVEAGEGPLRAERCALGDGPCRWDDVCPLHETWRAATDALRGVLGETSLADLANRDIDIELGRAGPVPDSHRHGRSSVPVEDWVYVEAAIESIADCLQHEDRMGRSIEEAYQEADALRAGLDAGGPPWSPVQVQATCITRVASAPGSDGATGDDASDGDARGTVAYTLSWEGVGPGGTTSHADVVLRATPVDPQRTEVKLSGRLRPPERSGEAGPDDQTTAHLTQVVVRSLLRRMARDLESPMSRAVGAGDRPPPGGRRSGRRPAASRRP